MGRPETLRPARASESAQVRSLLAETRIRRGLSQGALAGLARSTERTVRALERGELRTTPAATLLRIAAVLEVGPADLWPVFGALPRRKRSAE